MKKLILFTILVLVGLVSLAQREVDANVIIVRDSIIMTDGKVTDMGAGVFDDDGVIMEQLNDTVAKYSFVQPIDSVALNIPDISTTFGDFTIYRDTANNTNSFKTGLGSTLQIGRESLIKVYNNNGVTIPNGAVMGGIGVMPDGTIMVERAIATNRYTALLWATTDILVGDVGDAVVVYGSVRDVPTTGLSLGQVWLSAVDSGEVVNTAPVFPAYEYSLGAATIIDAVNGQYEARLDAVDFNNITRNSWNGSFSETFKFEITATGGVITGTLQRDDDAGDLTGIFSDGYFDYDVFPTPKTIVLTAGTDGNEQLQYVYIDITTKELAVSTAYWPSTEHIPIAVPSLQSAATVELRGATRNQFTNNHIADLDNLMGKFDHFSKRLRSFSSDYENGIDITTVGSGTTTVYSTFTGGNSWQLHLQPFESKDISTDYIKVENDFTSPGVWVNDYTDVTTDASGGSLNNNSHSIVIIGVNNSGSEVDQLIMNMPTGTYNNSTDAIADDDKKTVYSIPLKYKGTAILLYRLTFSVTGAGTIWTLNDTEDLRGLMPSTAPGGGPTGGGVTTYLGLSDTYSSFVTLATTGLKVSGAENALEATQWTEDASGNFTIGNDLSANILESTVATGTSPLTIASTTLNTNLNADFLDGQHGSYYLDLANSTGDSDDITEGSTNLFSPFTDAGTVVYPTNNENIRVGDGSNTGDKELLLQRGTLADGFIDTRLLNSGGDFSISSGQSSTWTNRFEIDGLTGQQTWASYVATGSHTITPVGMIVFDASGNIGTQAISGGASPLTTKGDLFTYTTVDARLGVGSNGQSLFANSAQSTGLEWATSFATDANGLTYSAGNVGIGTASSSVNALKIDGSGGSAIQANNSAASSWTMQATNAGNGASGAGIFTSSSTSGSVVALKGVTSAGGSASVAIVGQNSSTTANVHYGGIFQATGGSNGIALKIEGGKSAILTDFNTAPSSTSDTGTEGEIRFATDAIYVATATDTWKKADLTPTRQALTSSASITFDGDNGTWASLTLAHNATLTFNDFSDFTEGVLRVTQDVTGNRTLAFAETITAVTSIEYSGGLSLINPDATETTVIRYTLDDTVLRLDVVYYE